MKIEDADIALVARLDSVAAATRRLPAGTGDVAGAAATLLAAARSALADAVGSSGVDLQLETVTEVQAAETLALRGVGRVQARGGRWLFTFWEDDDG